MLQPRAYPEFVAKALVLDNDPFEAMVDDDNPWMEGFVLVVSVSLLAGLALAIGGFLTAATLPDPNVMLTALLQGWRQTAATLSLPSTSVEQIITEVWAIVTLLTGYAGGWSHLLPMLSVPGMALVWWLFFSVTSFGIARAFGGSGSLNATFGATALTVAPLSFLLFSSVPFATVSSALLITWSGLIGYRAVHVAQEIDWRRAALTTLLVYAIAFVFILLMGIAFGAGYSAGGLR
ncbi:MAG: YIP1 family protein [Caldilinea sp.]|uniref:YIP1 family protein n=1 Tax=Caldilinea sp. TaxID=2293560 RepID=UPI002B694519|nr:hypothetical protein [Anaerolineales bacterium]HQY95095.1 YIP1 family protein [Caldilinea sp.]